MRYYKSGANSARYASDSMRQLQYESPSISPLSSQSGSYLSVFIYLNLSATRFLPHSSASTFDSSSRSRVLVEYSNQPICDVDSTCSLLNEDSHLIFLHHPLRTPIKSRIGTECCTYVSTYTVPPVDFTWAQLK